MNYQQMLIIGIIVITVIYVGYTVINDMKSTLANEPWLIYGTKSASSSTIVVPAEKVPMSQDGQYGIEFSYSLWMFINSVKGDKYKHVFHKGNSTAYPLQAPGVWIYPNENKLGINMNTFSSLKESCDVGNIPMGKWFHLSIVVMNHYIDIYINGELKKRCKFKGLPKQNYDDVIINNWEGYDGFISQFRYFSYALPYYKIEQILKQGPSQAPCNDTGEGVPPYLASDYWQSTGFPDYTGKIDTK